jgi:dCMP deaminase
MNGTLKKMKMNKWDNAHMNAAEVYAQLSSATRLKVGCVIVKDNRIISIGYNGMPAGWTNKCETTDEFGNMPVTKPEVLHAETNAIAKVARSGESCEGATLYTTHSPCLDCAKLIYQAGISRVVWKNQYKTDIGNVFLVTAGVDIGHIE